MPQTVAFTKGHGTGNDFVVIPDPDGALDLSDDDAVPIEPLRMPGLRQKV